MDSPTFLSFPHSYLADPSYLSQFSPESDLEPRKELHESKIAMEPVGGETMAVKFLVFLSLYNFLSLSRPPASRWRSSSASRSTFDLIPTKISRNISFFKRQVP